MFILSLIIVIITTFIIFTTDYPDHRPSVAVAICASCSISLVVLATELGKVLN